MPALHVGRAIGLNQRQPASRGGSSTTTTRCKGKDRSASKNNNNSHVYTGSNWAPEHGNVRRVRPRAAWEAGCARARVCVCVCVCMCVCARARACVWLRQATRALLLSLSPRLALFALSFFPPLYCWTFPYERKHGTPNQCLPPKKIGSVVRCARAWPEGAQGRSSLPNLFAPVQCRAVGKRPLLRHTL